MEDARKKKRDENKIVSPEFTPTKSEKTGAALKVSPNTHGLIFGNIFHCIWSVFIRRRLESLFYCRIKLREEELPAWGALVYYASGIPISITYFAINAVLLLISVRIIGLKFSLRTIYGVAIMTLFFSVLPQAVPGTFVGKEDNFMACVIGGLLSGAGIGLVFLSNGSSGGTDIIAKVVNKYRNITLGRTLLYCDVLIICSSYFLEFGSLEKIVYGLTAMAITTITVDMVINGVRQSVQFFIFSKEYEQIATRINIEVHRGVTLLDGMGWYSKEPVKVITVIARKNESIKFSVS